MKRIAILIKNLGGSQLSFEAIRQVNAYLSTSHGVDINFYHETIARQCVTPKCASMNIMDAWGFDGPVIATCLSTARKALGFPSATKKIFYAYDLDWMRLPTKSFADLHSVYGNPELALAARCSDHAKMMEAMWHKPVAVIEGFNIDRLIELAQPSERKSFV